MKLDALVQWYESLTPETIHDLGDIYHENARFRDPFNDVYGHEAIAGIFRHMFDATKNPSFRITERQMQGRIAWVSWTFTFGLRGEIRSIEGVTRLAFGDDGRVVDHRDFWDATVLLEAFPFIGAMLRFIKRRLHAPGSKKRNRK